MSAKELPDDLVERATYGVSYVAERGALVGGQPGMERMARAALSHALSSGGIMLRSEFDERLKVKQEDVERWKRSWSSVCKEKDDFMVKAQIILSAIDDRELAEVIARGIGVMLLPMDEED